MLLDSMWFFVLAVLSALGLGFSVGFLIRRKFGQEKLEQAELRVQEMLREAEAEAKTIRKEGELEVKDAQLKARQELDKEVAQRMNEVQQVEKRLLLKEETLDKRAGTFDKKEEEFLKREQAVQDRQAKLGELEKRLTDAIEEARRNLERVSGLSAEEAKKQLQESMLDDAKRSASKLVQDIEENAKQEAVRKAQKIISISIERLASDYVAERTVSVVQLPSEEMKGRIIGREGRNIRALEAATGIDVIIDDTPEAVILSGFNPIRREVARRTLEGLIGDGRIHPTRIEEMVEKITKQLDQEMKETGEKVCMDLNLPNVHVEIQKLIGALKYRSSYAQNMLQHSIEVSHIAGMMAAELGIDVRKAKRAALMHDMGKALTHEVEGSHALIGMELAKKYGEADDVCHAIGAHHEDIPQETALDLIVDAADALSGARPGARREVLEAYVKRLEDLERIATSFKGVERCYAIQAGREIRVMVSQDQVNDGDAFMLSKDIAKKIEAEMTYPGQIKVTVIRETRAVEYAK